MLKGEGFSARENFESPHPRLIYSRESRPLRLK